MARLSPRRSLGLARGRVWLSASIMRTESCEYLIRRARVRVNQRTESCEYLVGVQVGVGEG